MQWMVAQSSESEAARAVDEVVASLGACEPSALVVVHSAALSADVIRAAFAARFPGVPTVGSTSCQGALSTLGLVGGTGAGLVVAAIIDPDGAYGAASVGKGEDPRSAAAEAVEAALGAAERDFESPELVWLAGVPGGEEQVLAGIQEVVGDHVPVLGGSAADDTVAGGWSVWADRGDATGGIALLVAFPSGPVGHAFRCGYEPTEQSAEITRAEGREVVALDGEPAGLVYDRWTAGGIGGAQPGRNVLAETTLAPLGLAVGETAGVTEYLLVHPASVTDAQGLACFADVAEGDRLVCMTGSVDSLVSRIGRVAQDALEVAGLTADEVAGALVVYCGGCRLTVSERVSEVSASLSSVLPGVPLVGTFTFGEQGPVSTGQSRHGNLMISVVVFGRD